MDPAIVGLIGIGCLAVVLMLGIPIGISLVLIGMGGLSVIVGVESAFGSAMETIYHKIASYDLVTIPLFVLMGYLASAGGLSEKLFNALNMVVGRVRGGLGISAIGSCTAFGTVCGSALVVASVFAKICAPEMRRYGYEKKLAYGICASAGMIGMLIPPSIFMVVYGIQSGDSIGKLLIAGITPGLILTLFFSVLVYIVARRRSDLIAAGEQNTRYTAWEKVKAFASLWQIWVLALVIFGGIFGGIFNPTEAAAVASTLLMALLILNNIKNPRHIWDMFRESLYETASTSCMIFLVMAGASVFTQFLVVTGLTDMVADFVLSFDIPLTAMVALIVLVYVILGCFLDSFSMICITVPVFNPIVMAQGADPIWYAVMVAMAIHLGLITPPVGLNVYGAFAVAEPDVTLEDIFVGIMPFFWAVLLAIILLLFVQPISTFLPNLMTRLL
jgi:tripartite ATP-independent transporter DctM subunit